MKESKHFFVEDDVQARKQAEKYKYHLQKKIERQFKKELNKTCHK
jgi:hypothetical protein